MDFVQLFFVCFRKRVDVYVASSTLFWFILCVSRPNQGVAEEETAGKERRKLVGTSFQCLNHFFLCSKDPSHWERYSAYDPRYRDPRYQRYWYDHEHNPYQKREAYPYGNRFVCVLDNLARSGAAQGLGASDHQRSSVYVRVKAANLLSSGLTPP